MAIDNRTPHEIENQSYGAVMRELGSSTKDLIHSEINLMTAEMKYTAQNVGKHIGQAIIFGSLLVLSVFPFVAFLVIGLGNLMGNQYWLSSLIVAIVFAAIGGPMAYRSFKKIKEEDLKLPHTQAAVERQRSMAQQKFDDVKSAAKGDRYESQRFHT